MVTPVAHALWVGGSLFLVLLGFLAFATRPGASLNRVLGALLVLRGASDLFYEFMRDAASPADALFAVRVANWYDWPTLFLTLLFLHLVAPPRRFPRARTAVLALAGVLTAALVGAFAFAPAMFPYSVLGPPGGFSIVTPVVPVVFTILVAAVQLAGVVLAVQSVAAAEQTLVQRRRSALTGLSFGLLLGQAGLPAVSLAVTPLLAPGFNGAIYIPLPQDAAGTVVWYARGLVYGVGFVAMLVALPRLANAFDGRGRTAFFAAGVSALAVGLAQAIHGVVFLTTGAELLPPISNAVLRVPFVVLSAACLALALVRFGMAGFGAPTQRRVAAVSQVAIVATLALLPVGVFLALTGADALLLGAAFLLALGALTFSPAPLRAASEALSRLLLVSPGEHAAVGERARLYTTALQERAGDTGGTPPASDPRLRALRAELGITEHDHDLLAQTVRTSGSELLLGRYRVERELGRGAFGTASLATDTATGQKVVLKRFHGDWMERRALAEARALAVVRHPRVVPLLALERVGGEVFLVLGHVPGGTAEQLLAREGPLPAARAAALAADVLEGLAALHAAGLAHGDVKPSNVFLDAGGRGVLGDLGAAQLEQGPGEGTVTMSPVLGSMATLAPEVLRGARKTPASDLYSAGALLYRLLTGGHYLDLADKAPAVAVELVLNHPPRLPHPRVPPDFEAVLRRALAKRPVGRYGSADEMRAAVLAAGRGPRAGPSPARRRARSSSGSAGPG